jgi:uncharacterized protein (DUF305 family)
MAALVGFVTGCAAPASQAPAPSAAASPSASDGPRIVQAGAPGQPSRTFEGTSLSEVEGIAWTDADVVFMQGMIHHHAQALEMTALIDERTPNRTIQQMGLRMQISQGDEIALMSRWLRDRGQDVPDWRAMPTLPSAMDRAHAAHEQMEAGMHAGHSMSGGMAAEHSMPGMLSTDQMLELEAARGTDFDRLFLTYMIQHHEGAIVMVRELFSAPGAGQESQVFQFASEVDADQTIEIRRMRQVLSSLPAPQ